MLTRAVMRWLGAAAGMLIAACGGGAVTTPALAPRDTTPPPPAVLVIPSIGAPDVLDVATWNVEWFGDPANGPTDEARQLANVRTVIGSADVDVWGLQEVVSVPAFRSMLAAMPGYDGVVATDSAVQDGRAWYGDFNDTGQKVALV